MSTSKKYYDSSEYCTDTSGEDEKPTLDKKKIKRRVKKCYGKREGNIVYITPKVYIKNSFEGRI